MNSFTRLLSRGFWSLLALCAFLPMSRDCVADDDTDKAEKPVEVERVLLVEKGESFDRWILQSVRGGTEVRNVAVARAELELQLKAKLEELTRDCELNDAQRQKLELAARGDIKRFFDQVDEGRRRFVAARVPADTQQVLRELTSVKLQFSKGLFGNDSLFEKSLRRTLTPEQHARHQKTQLEQRRVRYGDAIAASLSNLGSGTKLQPDQLSALQSLLLEETPPPLQFGQYDNQIVMLRLSQLPTDKITGILDRNQWKQLRPQMLEASGTEDWLAQQGLIEQSTYETVILRSIRTVVEAPAVPADAAKPE